MKRKILNPASKSKVVIYIDEHGNKRWKFKSSSYKSIAKYHYGNKKK